MIPSDVEPASNSKTSALSPKTSASSSKVSALQTIPAAPPPPPPPPPPPKTSSSGMTIPRLPSFRSNAISSTVASLLNPNTENKQQRSVAFHEPFRPGYLFVYGTLMDPNVLQTILSLPDPPLLQPATITGFAIRMWGIYPALVPNEKGTVAGMIWRVETEEHFVKLAEYETSAYTWCRCTAVLASGEALEDCRAFCWAGDPESKELDEGCFDLERYRKYFKSSVIRERK